MMVSTSGVLYALLLVHLWAFAASKVISLVNSVSETGEVTLDREAFEGILPSDSTGPIYIWTVLGNSRVGKSTFLNFIHDQGRGWKGEQQQAPFDVCHKLKPCTKRMLATAVPRQEGGTNVFIDAEGGNLAENYERMSVYLTIAACMSSGPIVLVDTDLNDNTYRLVARIAAHILDPKAQVLESSCSFRQGGPRLLIVVNRNENAVQQEEEEGGLKSIWDTVAATPTLVQERMVVNKVFRDIEFAALPAERDLRDLDTEYGRRMLIISKKLQSQSLPATLVGAGFEQECMQSADTCVMKPKRYQGNAATISFATQKLFQEANVIIRNKGEGSHGAASIHDQVTADVRAASAACLQEFVKAIAQWSTPVCRNDCSGEPGGCEVVREWTAPDRAAAEKCFAEHHAVVRLRVEPGHEDPFGASVVAPAMIHLKIGMQSKVDALQVAWQHANSLDPARTVTTSEEVRVASENRRVSPRRYGGRCYGLVGGREFADYADIVKFQVRSTTTTFKRCGAELKKEVKDIGASYEREMNRHARNMC